MEDSREEETKDLFSPTTKTSLEEEEVVEVLEESLEVDRDLTEVPRKETLEKTLRPKMQTKTDADTAEKLDIG